MTLSDASDTFAEYRSYMTLQGSLSNIIRKRHASQHGNETFIQ
jgi:hypothetical protein